MLRAGIVIARLGVVFVFVFVLVSALGLVCVRAAAAAADDASEAERLFAEARRLLDSDEYDLACDKLARSQELDPALGTLALLAYCHEMQGRTATAHREYAEAARWAERAGDSERQAVIERQRDKLTPRLSTLRLNVPHAVAGQTLHRAGKPVERAAWGFAVPVDPGTILVESRAPGYRAWTANVQVGGEGARVEIDVPRLSAELDREASSLAMPPLPALIALGVGAAGIGVGTYYGLRAKSLKDDSDAAGCDSASVCTREGYDLRKDARSSARVSNIGFGVGLAGIATGVIWLLLDTSAERPQSSRTLQIAPSSRGAWAGIQQTF